MVWGAMPPPMYSIEYGIFNISLTFVVLYLTNLFRILEYQIERATFIYKHFKSIEL